MTPFRDRSDSRASERIRKFCEAVLGSRDEAQLLVHELDRSRELREIAETPFVLALICWHFRLGRLTGDGARLDLYRAVVDGLLTRESDRRRDGSLRARKPSALRAIAWVALEQESSLNEIQAIAAITGATSLETTTQDEERLLNEHTEVDGILRRNGDNIEFLHSSIAEYLAAERAANNPQLTATLVESAHDERWQGAVVFLAGLVHQPEAVFRSLAAAPLTPPTRARLMSACLMECRKKLAPESLATVALQVVAEAQLAVKLPWRNLAAHRVLWHALSDLAQHTPSMEGVVRALDLVRERNLQAQIQSRKSIVDEEFSDAKKAAVGALSHDLALVRWVGGWLCGVLRDHTAVNDLIKLLQDPQSSVRGMAAWALAHVRDSDGQPVRDAAAQLRSALSDEESSVKRLAASSLGWLEDGASAPLLVQLLNAEDSYLATSAAYALSRLARGRHLLGVDVVALAARLRAALRGDEELARTAAGALGSIAGRYHALDAETVDQIASMLKSSAPATRRAVAYALKELAEVRHTDLLLAQLRQETDSAVLVSLCKAIGRLKISAAYDRLTEMLASDHGSVRASVL